MLTVISALPFALTLTLLAAPQLTDAAQPTTFAGLAPWEVELDGVNKDQISHLPTKDLATLGRALALLCPLPVKASCAVAPLRVNVRWAPDGTLHPGNLSAKGEHKALRPCARRVVSLWRFSPPGASSKKLLPMRLLPACSEDSNAAVREVISLLGSASPRGSYRPSAEIKVDTLLKTKPKKDPAAMRSKKGSQ